MVGSFPLLFHPFRTMGTFPETSPALLPVLVATKKTQGQRKNDFAWCDEDEPVRFGSECDGEPVDGKCGCRRAMVGILSLKATTTMRVKLLPLARSEYVAMLKASLDKTGLPFDQAEIEGQAEELLSLAAAFPADRVVEKRGNKMQTRA